MSDVKIDETTNEMLAENGDRDDGTAANSVSDGEIVEDDELDDASLPALTAATKVPKNFRSRNDRSDSEDEIANRPGKGAASGDPRISNLRPNGAPPMSKNEMERLRHERKHLIDELGRRNVINDRKPTQARQSLDAPRNNDVRSGFRRSMNDQNARRNNNNFRDRPTNFRAHPQQQQRAGDDNARQPNSDEFRVNGINGTTFFPKSMIKYTKASPSISYSQNPTPRERKRFSSDNNQKSRIKNRRSRSRSVDKKQQKHDKKSDKVKSPTKSSRDNDKPSPAKLKSTQVKEKSPVAKVEEKKTESLEESHDVDDANGSTTPPIITANFDDEKPTSDRDDREKSPDPESLSKDIDSIFGNVKFPKIEMKIEKKKSPKKLEKPRVNIFLEDSDEVDEFENTAPTFEVKSRWTTPPRVVEKPTIDKIEPSPLVLVPTKVIETKKSRETSMPVVVESPERSPIITSIDNIFSIAKSPSPPPKPKSNVKNVCSFLTDIASGNFFSDFLGDEKKDGKIGGLSKKNDESHVEPDTTVAKASDRNSDDDSDDSSSDSDDSDSDDSSSSSSSDTTTSESEEEDEESSDDEPTAAAAAIATSFSGFGTFSSSSMPMVQQIRPMSTPSTPASITTPTHVPAVSAIRPGLIPFPTKTPLFTPSPIKSLQANPISQSPFMPSAAVPGIPAIQIPGVPGIPVFPFKIYSLRDSVVFTPPITPSPTPSISTPVHERRSDKDDKDRGSEKRDRDRKRSRSRSTSRERDRKRTKDDRRKSPVRKRRDVEDKRESRRREDDRRHRSSPIRKRKSRSKTPQKNRSPVRRSKTPPIRPRTPPPKRRSSPHRRSISRSPPAKHRRSVSPAIKRGGRSPSPNHRRSPRRSRHSRSPNRSRQQQQRRSPSPNLRYDRRSYSPAFRGKMESPSLYKPDSTISDTELERQQQMHNEDFYGQWSNQNSPKRPNLEDRINNILTDSPSYQQQQQELQKHQQYSSYPDFGYDNHQQMFQNDMYGMYDEYGNYISSRNYVNNSNLVEITQQRREKQRVDSSQVAVQVGNCLQIVPTKAVPEAEKPKLISTAEIRAEAKAKRKVKRDRKRQEKAARKEKLRREIQRYFDAGITADNSDNEELIPLKSINVAAVAERGILRKVKNEVRNERRVLFKDGIMPGESTSDDEVQNDQNRVLKKLRREKFKKKRLAKARKGQPFNGMQDPNDVKNENDIENQPPPNAPPDSPPANLPQPRLKKITPEMFAAFPVDPSPMYYYIEQLKVQMSHANNGYHHQQQNQPPRSGQNERFSYYKKFAPPPMPQQQQNPGQFQNNHSHQQHYHHHHHQQSYNNHHQRSNMMPPRSSQSNSISALDPRINQQRAAEKTFA